MEIVREKVKITPDVFVALSGTSYVDWAAFCSEEPPPFVPEKVIKDLKNGKTSEWFHSYNKNKVKDENDHMTYCGSACFYSVPEGVHRIKANRMVYRIKVADQRSIPLWNKTTLKYDQKQVQLLVISQANNFLNLCKEYKLLPDYIPDSPIEKDGTGLIVLDISDYTLAQIYMYLCAARYVQEYPMCSWTAAEIAKKYGMNFYLALAWAHSTRAVSMGHTLLELSGASYGKNIDKNGINEVSLDVSHAVALAKFAKDPHKYHSGLVTDPKAGSVFGFQLHLRNIASKVFGVSVSGRPYDSCTYVKDAVIKTQDFFDEDIVAAVMADTNEESKKHFDAFKKKKITYVDEIKVGPIAKASAMKKKIGRPRKVKIMEAN